MCTALLLNDINLCTNVLVDISCSFRVISPTTFKVKNKQRAKTNKIGKTELRCLCIAPLLNEIELPTGFLVDILYSFRVMFRTMFKV